LFFCGVKGVGKTSLVTRYCQNRFPHWYDPIEPNQLNHHSVETISNHRCLFECVEIDSPDSLQSDISESCPAGWKSMNGLVLVYDVGDRASFTALPAIYQKLSKLSGKATGEIPVAVIANKVDMFQDSRHVSHDEGGEFAEAIGGFFAQVSARECDGVRGSIQQIMRDLVKIRVAELDEIDEREQREREVREAELREDEERNMTRRQKLKRNMSSKMSRLSVGSTGSWLG